MVPHSRPCAALVRAPMRRGYTNADSTLVELFSCGHVVMMAHSKAAMSYVYVYVYL